MKAIVFERRPAHPVTDPPLLHLVPDSALTVAGQPVFLPELPGAWEVRAGVALRIGRLGKGISPKFAPRYIDGVTLALQAIPITVEAALKADGAPTDAVWTFDGALTPGKWLPFDPEAGELTFSLGELTRAVTAAELMTPQCIAAVSALMTLKTGDVIVPALCEPGLSIKAGDTLQCTFGGVDVLTYKVR